MEMTIVKAFRPIMWFARRTGLAPSPLRRPVDRVESLLLAGAVLLALAAVPFTIAVGQATYTGALHTAAAQRAARTQLTATLVQNAPSDNSAPGVFVTIQAMAVWTAADGSVHSGQVSTAPGTPSGTGVPIWVDQRGQSVAAPLTADQAAGRGLLTGLLAELAVIATLVGLCALLRLSLNRRRAADWENEWRTIGPQWTKYRI